MVAGYDFVGDAFTGVQTGPAAVRGGMPVRRGEGGRGGGKRALGWWTATVFVEEAGTCLAAARPLCCS